MAVAEEEEEVSVASGEDVSSIVDLPFTSAEIIVVNNSFYFIFVLKLI